MIKVKPKAAILYLLHSCHFCAFVVVYQSMAAIDTSSRLAHASSVRLPLESL